jgi:hAT family C-terminal dimerisation region
MDVLGPNTTQPTAHETPLEELARYLATHCISANSDPLAWWKVEQHTFPSLACMAHDFLAIPGMQVF